MLGKKIDRGRWEKGRTSRIQGVNVNAEIYRLARTNPVFYLLNNPGRPDRVNLASLDNFEAAITIIFIVAEARQGGPDASMDIGVICEQAF